MVFEGVIASFDTVQLVVVLALFALFLYISQKVAKTLINTVIIAVISAIFPFLVNMAGIAVPTDLNAVLFFVVAGVGFYLLYVIAKIVLVPLGIVSKLFPGKK